MNSPGKSHATNPAASAVPEEAQRAVPEGLEKALPDSTCSLPTAPFYPVSVDL